MKNKVLVIIGLTASVFLSGCGKSAPACGDSDSKELVMQISEPKIKNALMGYVTNKHKQEGDYPNAYGNYEWIVKHVNDENFKPYASAIEEVDNIFNDIALVNIRTELQNDKLLTTECAADMPLVNINLPITYKLSITSEGELYGVVYGL